MGEQKTDDGVNIYHKCRSCGILLVTTPGRKVYGVDGVPAELPHNPSGPKTKS
jgi:hypothetical protein